LRYPTHTPYRNGEGGVKVGLEPIKENKWLELDDLFVSEIKQKEKLYKTCLEDVYKETKDSVESQYELLNLLKSHLRTYHPTHKPSFNKKLSPLIQASLLVQEDLVLMLPRGKEYFLGAASLCAPSNWSLKKKFNHSLLHLHKNVPTYASKIGTRVNTFFKKLPNEKIFQRFNWSIYENPVLFQPAKSKTEIKRSNQITENNAGKRLFIRVERQTIRRLPVNKSIIFTIRVHVNPLDSIKQDFDLLLDLRDAVKNLTKPMKKYKSIDQINGPLVRWLELKLQSSKIF